LSAEYRAGDVIKIERTLRIFDVLDGELWANDVQNNESYAVTLNGSLRVQMVKRAVEPKPPAGTVLKGKDVRRIWWKRGTIIRCVSSEGGLPVTGYAGMVLRADGKWHVLDNENAFSQTYEFDELATDARFELRFVA
jgi:hypothetical protein